jgi:hypothetical protein
MDSWRGKPQLGRMRHAACLALTITCCVMPSGEPLLAAAKTTAEAATETPAHLAYGCHDLIVIGRVQNLRRTHVQDAEDILGQGRNLARVDIHKVLWGKPSSKTISVQYFAHTYMQDRRDFLLVLAPAGGDVYEIRDARLERDGHFPDLAPACSETPK